MFLYYFFAIIVTARLAYAVSKLHLVALGALDDARKGHYEVASATVTATSTRNLFLRYSHFKVLLLVAIHKSGKYAEGTGLIICAAVAAGAI